MTADGNQTAFQRAKALLHELGVELVSTPGAYRFRYTRNDRTAPFLLEVAEDLEDAISIGRELAKSIPPAPLPPLGPTGRRKTRRGAMYRHNRRIAAKRRRKLKSPVRRNHRPSDKEH